MSTDLQYFKRLKEAEVTSSTDGNLANTAGAVVAQTFTRQKTYGLPAQSNGNANVSELLLDVAPFAGRLRFGNVTVAANLAANVASYSVLTVFKRTNVGGGNANTTIVVATANLSNVAVQAFVPYALTIANTANAQVASSDVLTYQILTGGSPGVAVGVAVLDLCYEDV